MVNGHVLSHSVLFIWHDDSIKDLLLLAMAEEIQAPFHSQCSDVSTGPFQMFGELVDSVLFSAGELLYLEELPVAYAQQHWKNQPRSLAESQAWWM